MYQIFSEHQRKTAMACRVRDQGEHGDRERRGGVRRGLGRGQEQRVQPAAIWHDWLPGEHHHCPGMPAAFGSQGASQGFQLLKLKASMQSSWGVLNSDHRCSKNCNSLFQEFYGINESKISAYSPSESQKIYERAVTRRSGAKFNPKVTLP